MHPYTIQDDFLYFTNDPISEYEFYFNELGVDGMFTESPRTAILTGQYMYYKGRSKAEVGSRAGHQAASTPHAKQEAEDEEDLDEEDDILML